MSLQLIDHHNFLINEDEEVRLLILLTIDPAIRKDFEFLGPHELIQLVEEGFHEPVRQEKLRIYEKIGETRLRKGHNVSAHFLKIEGYLEELYKLGHPLSQEASDNGFLGGIKSQDNWKNAPKPNSLATQGLSRTQDIVAWEDVQIGSRAGAVLKFS
ncbi:hypothetical protein L2E82_35885 [Cichorium intybus]|uniref:Uncharacterized protein n=1 Tax=Cichorium intybus TaxID=13427 RepID=A0ACB9BQA9_CICIN|nr:hypothetical protein L2E82_35885 [Cichorium intybus]